jgi:hypothetical protein
MHVFSLVHFPRFEQSFGQPPSAKKPKIASHSKSNIDALERIEKVIQTRTQG